MADFTLDASMEYWDPHEADYVLVEASTDREFSWTCCPFPPNVCRSSTDHRLPSGRKEERGVREDKSRVFIQRSLRWLGNVSVYLTYSGFYHENLRAKPRCSEISKTTAFSHALQQIFYLDVFK